jgi:hypothetical protein
MEASEKWQTKLLHARIAIRLLFSRKTSRLFLLKGVFKTNRSVALIAGRQGSSNQEEIAGAVTEGQNVKCSRLYAQNVEKKQLFHLSQPLKSQFIARIAINEKPDNKEYLPILGNYAENLIQIGFWVLCPLVY